MAAMANVVRYFFRCVPYYFRIPKGGTEYLRRGIGKLLIRFAFRLALELRDRFGCVGVVVDAKVAAIPFYGELGFRPLEAMQGALGDRPEPLPMFLAIRRISAALD